MFIGKLKIGEKELIFDKSKKVVFIREDNNISSTVYDAFKDIFSGRDLSISCNYVDECDLYCECEKSGIDFNITLNTKQGKLFDGEDVAGLSGNFEIKCKFKPQEPMTDVKKRMLQMIKEDFQEFLLKEEIADLAFFKYIGCMYYIGSILNDDYIIRKAKSVIKEFVDDFDYIYFDNFRLGFDRDTLEFQLAEEEVISDTYPECEIELSKDDLNERQWDIVYLWDYLTANKLNEKLENHYGYDGKTPLFIKNAFEKMTDDDIKKFMKEIRSLDRQVFIFEKKENALLESLCDEKMIFEKSLEDDFVQ